MFLTAEEDVYAIADEIMEKGRDEMKPALLGRLLTRNPYNKGDFQIHHVYRLEDCGRA